MKRIYGVAVDQDGKEVALTVTALIMMTNCTLGGTPTASLQRVDRWDNTQIQFAANLNDQPGVFLDPLGFLIPLRRFAQ